MTYYEEVKKITEKYAVDGSEGNDVQYSLLSMIMNGGHYIQMSNKSLYKICLCIIAGLYIMIFSPVNVNAGTLPSGSYYPDSCDLSHCDHPEAIHFYATGRTYSQDAECAEGAAYFEGEITNRYYDGTGVPSYAPGQFSPDFQKGWYYLYLSQDVRSLCRCDGDHNPDSAAFSSDEKRIIDHDTYKSEAPSGTFIASDSLEAKQFFDLKVHSVDAGTETNQKLLVQHLVGNNAKILTTDNIYPRRDLTTTENGLLKILTRNMLPRNRAGAVKAVVYNQIDGAYVISGSLDANGTAVFSGFKLRPASTITICR